jgi:hypothetical protein
MNNTNRNGGDAIGCGILLVGLGILFLRADIDFWPHILLVFAAAGVIGDLVKGNFAGSAISLILWGGLYAWFTGYLTGDPAVLLPVGVILTGVVMMLGALQWRRPRPSRKVREPVYDYELAEDWQ